MKWDAFQISRVAAVLLLGVMGAHRYTMVHTPPGTGEYHARIRNAASLVPEQIAGWVGSDAGVPTGAEEVLKPNLIMSRAYIDVGSGDRAGVLLVHCSDAHDMVGHYPPRCYPCRGWVMRGTQARDWNAGGLRVTGTEYEFSMDEPGRRGAIVVANFVLMPGGKVLRNLEDMAAELFGAGRNRLGAAQLQIYFETVIPQERRDRAIEEILGGYRPVIDAILSGVPH